MATQTTLKTRYKFIHFDQISDEEWFCVNNKSDDDLGAVRWYPRWKLYEFCPAPHTGFDATCLADIQHFMGQLAEARKGR